VGRGWQLPKDRIKVEDKVEAKAKAKAKVET